MRVNPQALWATDGKTIETEIQAADKFWDAEDYLMQYLQKGGQVSRV